MRFFKIMGLCILGALAFGYFAWKLNYPTYSYRYRLTVNVEVDGEIRTGSSVIEIAWRGGPSLSGVPIYLPQIRGQAVFVDLKERGVLVALLRTGDTDADLRFGPRDVTWIGGRAFGNLSTNQELPALERLTGKQRLSVGNMPRFVIFSNPNDLGSMKRIEQQQTGLSRGLPDFRTVSANLRLISAEVEITNDRILVDIDKKLPWLPEMLNKQRREHGVVSRPGEFKLTYNKFIGDG